jgi:hypothetical protein
MVPISDFDWIVSTEIFYGAVTAGNGILAVTDGEKCKGHSVFFALIKSQDIDVINREGVIRLQRKRGGPLSFVHSDPYLFLIRCSSFPLPLSPAGKRAHRCHQGTGRFLSAAKPAIAEALLSKNV